MVFYKVNNSKDEQIINPLTKWVFINNELYTQKEIDKLKLPSSFIKKLFNKVEISKFKTYWFFGARFELKNI